MNTSNQQKGTITIKKTIAVDLDDVLANLLSAWLERINSAYSTRYVEEDITTWDMMESTGLDSKIYSELDYDLFRNLEVVEGSKEAIDELLEHYNVYIVSSATTTPDSLKAKVEWLEEHYPEIPKDNIVICGDKSIIRADYMVDDAAHNLESFQGVGILFDRTHNQDCDKFARAKDWKHVLEILKAFEGVSEEVVRVEPVEDIQGTCMNCLRVVGNDNMDKTIINVNEYGVPFDNCNTQLRLCFDCKASLLHKIQESFHNDVGLFSFAEKSVLEVIEKYVNEFSVEALELFFNTFNKNAYNIDRQDWIDFELGIAEDSVYEKYGFKK